MYADEGTPSARRESPDEQELIPTVMHLLTFAALHLCVRFYLLLFDRNGCFFFLAFDVAVDFGEDEYGG
jgi:hypothetical protein